MRYNALCAGLTLAIALAAGSLIATDSPMATLPTEETVANDPIMILNEQDESCGPEPEYINDPSVDLTAEWYSYGDCSGNYGPVDGRVSVPYSEVMESAND